MIQFTTIFPRKHLKLIPLQLSMERKLLKYLVNSKAETVAETLVYAIHFGQKRGEVCGLKKDLVFLAKYFFGYASGVFLGCTKMVFKGKNDVLSFRDVLQCLVIHEDTFLYTLCELETYQFFSPQLFLKIILTLHKDFVR